MTTRPNIIAQALAQPDTLRTLGLWALFFSLLILGLRPLVFAGEPYLWGGDFSTFWAASWLTHHDGLTRLYGTQPLTEIAGLNAPAPPWFYPPTMLLLVYPAALLGFIPAYIGFIALTLLASLFVWRVMALSRLHLILLAASPATLINVLYGQNGLLIAAIWCLGLLLLEQRRAVLAGLAFSLLLIKPQLSLLAPVLLLASGNWKGLGGFILGAVLFCGSAFLAFGPQPWLDFVHNLPAIGTLLDRGVVVDVNKLGSLYISARMSGAGAVEAMALQGILAALAIIACGYIWWQQAANFASKATVTLLAALLISPYQFVYDFALLLPALAYWHQAQGSKWTGADHLMGWALWLLPILSQATASFLGMGCTPLVIGLTLWRVLSTRIPTSRA